MAKIESIVRIGELRCLTWVTKGNAIAQARFISALFGIATQVPSVGSDPLEISPAAFDLSFETALSPDNLTFPTYTSASSGKVVKKADGGR